MKKYCIAAFLALLLIVAFLAFRSELTPATASNTTSAATFVAIRATAYARLITPTPTPLPPIANWKTSHTYSGTGNQVTPTFTVPHRWRLAWQCQGYSSASGQIGLLPHAGQHQVISDFASGACAPKGTAGHQNELGAGTFWLQVLTLGNGWTVQVQVPA